MRHAQHVREQGARAVRRLDARVERVAPGAVVVLAHGGARLERRGGHARDHEVERGHVGGTLERARHGVAVARLGDEGDVARRFVPDDGGAGSRRIRGGGDARERLVVHDDPFGGVDGTLAAIGDDQRDRIADMPRAPTRQGRTRRREGGRAVPPLARTVGGQVPHAVGDELGRREHAVHAWHCTGGACVDGDDAGVGVRRAYEHRVELARQGHVVRVPATALDQPRVLHTPDRLADGELLDDERISHDAPERSTVET